MGMRVVGDMEGVVPVNGMQVRCGEMAKWRNGVWLGLSSASGKERQKLREEGIEPPTAGTGIQRSTTELFPHANNYSHTTHNTQHTHTNIHTHSITV
jgi:hypothetical protein